MTKNNGLPDGWIEVSFSDIAYPVSNEGKKVPQKSYAAAGKYPVVDQGAAFIGGYTDDDSLVISPYRPLVVFGDHTRRVKFVDFPFVCGGDGTKLIAPYSAIDAKWFYYTLMAVPLPDRGYSRHYQFLTRSKFDLPPLAEQRRIVAALEEQLSRLDAGVSALERARANLKRYRTAVLKAAVEGELTEDWREENPDGVPASKLLESILEERRERWERDQLAVYEKKGKKPPKNWRSKYKEPARPNLNDLAELPKAWCWASLEQCSYRITDGTHQPPTFVDEGIPFLFVRHIVGGSISFENTKFITEKTYNELNSRCPVEVGDILYSAVGSYGVAVPVKTRQRFSFQRHIAHIKPVSQLSLNYLVASTSPL